jgi:hypothetical protein
MLTSSIIQALYTSPATILEALLKLIFLVLPGMVFNVIFTVLLALDIHTLKYEYDRFYKISALIISSIILIYFFEYYNINENVEFCSVIIMQLAMMIWFYKIKKNGPIKKILLFLVIGKIIDSAIFEYISLNNLDFFYYRFFSKISNAFISHQLYSIFNSLMKTSIELLILYSVYCFVKSKKGNELNHSDP